MNTPRYTPTYTPRYTPTYTPEKTPLKITTILINTPSDICKDYLFNDTLVSWYATSKSDPKVKMSGTGGLDISNRSTDPLVPKDLKVVCLNVNAKSRGKCKLNITDDKNTVSKMNDDGIIKIPSYDSIVKISIDCINEEPSNYTYIYVIVVIIILIIIGVIIYFNRSRLFSSTKTEKISTGGYFEVGE